MVQIVFEAVLLERTGTWVLGLQPEVPHIVRAPSSNGIKWSISQQESACPYNGTYEANLDKARTRAPCRNLLRGDAPLPTPGYKHRLWPPPEIRHRA